MSYSSRITEHLKAADIAHAAIDTSRRSRRLQRCQALLKQLDPDKPPAATQPREFHWQYRALRERVHLYSERLAAVDDPDTARDYQLRKTEWAIHLSLQYFRNVLTPRQLRDDDDGIDRDA